ncbi:Divergent polysaccharide deacetylase family protein [Azospirillaceae bacterium]
MANAFVSQLAEKLKERIAAVSGRYSFSLPSIHPGWAALIAAATLVAGVLTGLVVWLSANADITLEERHAAIPTVTTAISGGVRPIPSIITASSSQEMRAPEASAAATGNSAPPLDAPVTLVAAPAPGMTEESRFGLLPRLGPDNKAPWKVYARPFPANDRRPRIAIVISNLGLSGAATATAQHLPGGVTFSFAPVAERLDMWVERARADGHEVMISLPMEPINYPQNDPGPQTLLTFLDSARNTERLEWALARFPGYVGVMNIHGFRFLNDPVHMRPVLENIKRRGLMFLDNRSRSGSVATPLASQMGVPWAFIDRVIDRDPARKPIDIQLEELEQIAKRNGAAIGAGLPYLTTIERLMEWLPLLADRGIALAPVSAVAYLQKPEEPPPPPIDETSGADKDKKGGANSKEKSGGQGGGH